MRKLGVGLLVVGALGFAWLGWPTPYLYGDTNGEIYRVNRFTGIKQFTTADGWASEREMMAKVEAEVNPEIARFPQRVAELTDAARQRRIFQVDVMGRQVTAHYQDGSQRKYYARTMEDPLLSKLLNDLRRTGIVVNG